jgi:hypothetical protein
MIDPQIVLTPSDDISQLGYKRRVVAGSIGDFVFPKIPVNAYLYPTIPLYNSYSLAPVDPNSEWGDC